MAGVADSGAVTSSDAGATRHRSQWTVRPRHLGALLALRWKLGLRVYRRSVSALIGLAALLIFTLVAAVAAGFLSAVGYLNLPHLAAVQLLFGMLALLYIGWIVAPALQYSVNEGLDISKLHTYPVSRAERMLALTLSTFFDPTTIIILGIMAAVLIGWHTSALALALTVVALALLYVHIVGASQFALAVLIGLLRSRRYRDLSIIIFTLMSVACSLSGQFASTLLRHFSGIRSLGRLDLGHFLQWTPPGMAARAIVAANAGDPLSALPWLLGLLALTPLLLAAWAWVLDRGVTTPEGSDGSTKRRRRRTTQANPGRATAGGLSYAEATSGARAQRPRISPVVAAVATKDLRYFWRDPQIKASLLSSLVMLFIVFAPGLTQSPNASSNYFAQHLADLQPLLAPLPALLIVLTLSLNAFGLERQGIQTLFLTPARPLEVLWGKNLAVGAVAFSAQVVLIVAVCVVSGDWAAAPLALIEGGAATLALLGAGNVTSTLLPLRVRQLRMGSNNLSSESGCLRSVISLGALWVTLLVLAPVFVLLLLPALLEHRQWYFFTAPLAFLYGLALYQSATLIIAPRLAKRAPEILAAVAREV